MDSSRDELRTALLCYERGSAAYPQIDWSQEDYLAFCANEPQALHPDPDGVDEYVRLACLCRRSGAAAVLDADYIRPLRPTVSKVCRTRETTDVAMQQLREKLLVETERLARYRGTGSFKAWLRITAARTALDLVRQRGERAKREVQCEFEERLHSLATGPERRYMREELNETLRVALRRAVKRLPDTQRQALRFYVLSEWNIAQIGKVLGVHRATVARWLLSAKEHLGIYLREELRRERGESAEDVSELLRDLPSRLDVDLSRALRTAGATG